MLHTEKQEDLVDKDHMCDVSGQSIIICIPRSKYNPHSACSLVPRYHVRINTHAFLIPCGKDHKPKHDISRIIGTGHQNHRGFACPDRAVPQSKCQAIIKAHPVEPKQRRMVIINLWLIGH